MTTPSPSSRSPSLGRLTGFVLSFAVFICLTLIGLSGYLKFELDRAETALISPTSALTNETDVTEKLRRAYGFGGFIGLAQTYVATHDNNLIADMRTLLKSANEILGHLPDTTPAETRRDLQAIAATYDYAMQRAEKSSTDPNSLFTVLDLAPLYATLPVLDTKLETATAERRSTAQAETEYWSMLMTFVSWASLIITCAMAVGIYLTLLGRQSAPMRALSQSVKNMSQGDMRTSIWGMERKDALGELARAIDMARYQFSQVPDMSLLSDKGPVRIRFEGNTKSLFEAVMGTIHHDSELVRNQATALTETIAKQQEIIALLSSRVEAVLHNVEKRGLDGDKQVKEVLNTMLGTAQALKGAQEHAADQLNRIVPFLQERAQGMSEITQIAGKQIAQSLQSLTLSERGLKTSAEQSKDAIYKLASTADDLGDRLFGAVNLLQASGKVLAETTDTVQSRLNEAIANLDKGIAAVATPPVAPENDLATNEILLLAPRLEEAIKSLEVTNEHLETHFSEQSRATQEHIELLATHQNSMKTQSATFNETLSSATTFLREEQTKFDEALNKATERLGQVNQNMEDKISGALVQNRALSEKGLEQLSSLFAQFSHISEKLDALDHISHAVDKETSEEPAFVTSLQNDIRSGYAITVQNIEELRAELTTMISKPKEPLEEPAFVSSLQNDIRSGLSITLRNMEDMRVQLSTMAASATRAPSDALMEQMRDHWRHMAGQIEATRSNLEKIIIGQLEGLEARLANLNTSPPASYKTDETRKVMEQQTQILSELVATMGILDAHMQNIRSEVAAVANKKAG